MQDSTVYVVDDEPAIRDSLAMLLGSVGLKSRTFPSARHFLSGYQRSGPACLIADVRMPGISGLELQDTLKALDHALPVIIITAHGDVAMAVRAMKAGASDFIEKPFNEQVLLDAVHRALAEQQPRTPCVSGRAEFEGRVAMLTPREREVMLLIAEGLPNKVIASRLELSTRTVEVHRAKVMEKMQARSLAALVRMVIACELLAP